MENSNGFLKLVLDTMDEHVVVIDKHGAIKFINQSWHEFGEKNNCSFSRASWKKENYLEECDKAKCQGDGFGAQAANGIRQVINEELVKFTMEYPCHSADCARWFVMKVTPFFYEEERYFVICHQDITERKLAEEASIALARTDDLTGVANRRTLDEFLETEWKRSLRHQNPIPISIVDIDHFKRINDKYGHQTGDDCLRLIAHTLKKYASRAGDICARYGGDEFVLVWSGISYRESKALCKRILEAIDELILPQVMVENEEKITVSIGLACSTPTFNGVFTDLITLADAKLYEAKEQGRNRVQY
ncbi:sensor domain-containing diguanylate cyclase [Vibrio sp.]|nr:sensor domain-containing diguanylate cyclase [Vibrio sp.]